MWRPGLGSRGPFSSSNFFFIEFRLDIKLLCFFLECLIFLFSLPNWDKNLSLLCAAVDQYALQWAKWEIVELSVLSSWKEMVKGQIEERISKLK